MIDTIRKQLGERASLLDYKATGVAASMLHLPGPDFVDRVFVPSDRPSAVLRNGGTALAQARADFVLAKRALARARGA